MNGVDLFNCNITLLLFILLLSDAVDMSPAQNAFLELKLAAIRHLEYEEFLQLIGEMASDKR